MVLIVEMHALNKVSDVMAQLDIESVAFSRKVSILEVLIPEVSTALFSKLQLRTNDILR